MKTNSEYMDKLIRGIDPTELVEKSPTIEAIKRSARNYRPISGRYSSFSGEILSRYYQKLGHRRVTVDIFGRKDK